MLKLIESVLLGWTEGARRGGWLVVALFLALAGSAGWFAAAHLKVDTDTSAMLDPGLPFQERAAALREAFPEIKSDIAVVVRAPTLDEAEAHVAALRARLIARPELFSGVFAPSADPFFLENGLLYLDTDDLEARLARMSKAAGLIETLVAAPTLGALFTTLADNDALAEKSDLGADTLQDIYAELALVAEASLAGERRPFAWMGALDTEPAPEGGHVRLLYATPALDFTRLQPAKPALAALKAELAELDAAASGRVETFVTGDPALRADELGAVTTGIGISFALSFAAVAVLLFFAYRSVYLSIVTLVSLVVSITLTAAFATLTVGELNLVSVAFTVLLVGLGLDFAIHLLLHLQERRAGGEDGRAALKGSVHEVGSALVLAAFTTGIGFFAFVPTDFDGIAQLGVIAGAGVVIAMLVALTLLPAAIGAIEPPAPQPRIRKAGGGVAERLSGPVAILTIIGGLASLALLPSARFDADPMALRDPGSASVRGFNVLFDDEDTLPYRLTLLARTRAEAEAAAAEAKALPTVAATRWLGDFTPKDQDDKLELIDFAAGSLVFALEAEEDLASAPDDASGAARLAERLNAAYAEGTPARRLADALARAGSDPAALDRLSGNVFAHWPMLVARLRAQLNADYVEEDALPDVLDRRYRSASGLWRVDILPAEDVRTPAALDRFVDDVEAAFPDIGGGAAQTRAAGRVIAASMLQATGIALAFVTVFLWLLLRRFSDVMLMLIPLLLAAALTTAAGVVFGIPFNYANVIVLPLLLGIGVDSGIHLVMRHRLVAVGESLYGTSTPRAVLFSALTTVASFGSLMLSPHRGTASMGQLLSIAIGFTLLCTLLVLPALIRWRDAWARRPSNTDAGGAKT